MKILLIILVYIVIGMLFCGIVIGKTGIKDEDDEFAIALMGLIWPPILAIILFFEIIELIFVQLPKAIINNIIKKEDNSKR